MNESSNKALEHHLQSVLDTILSASSSQDLREYADLCMFGAFVIMKCAEKSLFQDTRREFY